MTDSWKAQFPPWILERGKIYHQIGRVHRLTHHGGEIRAVVEGRELYHVTVRFSRGIPSSAFCDCPLARDGARCKHMAALLFTLEVIDYIPTPDPASVSWEDALRELPAETLRIVLRNQAEQDTALQ